MPRLDPGLPLPLRLLESGPLARQGCRQLLGPLPQSAQRQIEVFELAPHQRQRDTETLLDHLAVALRFAALPRQAPHLRLHLADQVFEPGEIRRRLDRKSTRLNSSHLVISYAVFCLKKKKK